MPQVAGKGAAGGSDVPYSGAETRSVPPVYFIKARDRFIKARGRAGSCRGATYALPWVLLELRRRWRCQGILSQHYIEDHHQGEPEGEADGADVGVLSL